MESMTKNDFNKAALRIFYDMINADGFLVDSELAMLEKLKEKYSLTSQMVQEAHKITFAQAVEVIKRWNEEKSDHTADTFFEDLGKLSNVDGDCSPYEARILLAIYYVLKKKARIFSTRKNDYKFAKKEIIYLENDFYPVNNDISLNYPYYKKLLALYGFDLVYIPEVVKYMVKKREERLLRSIMQFVNPLILTNDEDAQRLTEEIQEIETCHFTEALLQEHKELLSQLMPSLLIKVKSSSVPNENNESMETFSDFLLIPLENVKSDIESFIQMYLSYAKTVTNLITVYSDRRFNCHGFHRTFLNFAVSRAFGNDIIKRVVFDLKHFEVHFEGAGKSLKLPPKPFALYLFITYTGGIPQHPNGIALDKITNGFNEIYYYKLNQEKIKLYKNIGPALTAIRNGIKNIHRLPNREQYMPTTCKNKYIVPIKDQSIFFIIDTSFADGEIPLANWNPKKSVEI